VLPHYHNISAITLSQLRLTLFIFSLLNDVVSRSGWGLCKDKW
jgi:hypothetical protein